MHKNNTRFVFIQVNPSANTTVQKLRSFNTVGARSTRPVDDVIELYLQDFHLKVNQQFLLNNVFFFLRFYQPQYILTE